MDLTVREICKQIRYWRKLKKSLMDDKDFVNRCNDEIEDLFLELIRMERNNEI